MQYVYIVNEWSVDWDGWQRGQKSQLMATLDREKAIEALGTRDQGWDVYHGEAEWAPGGYYGHAHGDQAHGKRREIKILQLAE